MRETLRNCIPFRHMFAFKVIGKRYRLPKKYQPSVLAIIKAQIYKRTLAVTMKVVKQILHLIASLSAVIFPLVSPCNFCFCSFIFFSLLRSRFVLLFCPFPPPMVLYCDLLLCLYSLKMSNGLRIFASSLYSESSVNSLTWVNDNNIWITPILIYL